MNQLLRAESDRGDHHHNASVASTTSAPKEWEEVALTRRVVAFRTAVFLRLSAPSLKVEAPRPRSHTLFLCADRTSCVRQEVGEEEEPILCNLRRRLVQEQER